MTRLPLPLLLIALTTLPVFGSEFVAQDGAPEIGDATASSPEIANEASLGECCLECCCPSWTANVGYVYLWRDAGGNAPVLTDTVGASPNFAAGPIVFSESDFNFDGSSGIDASLIRDDGCGGGLEIRYLWIDAASDQSIFFTPSVLPATNPLLGGGGFGGFGGFTWDIEYDSAIHSVELLRRQCCGSWNVSYGFRYANLDEFLYMSPFDPDFVFRNWTENNLYGLQLGADGVLWDNCCGTRIVGFGKAGLYYNDADVQAEYQNFTAFFRGTASDDDLAFLGELGITAEHQLSCNLSVRAGYQLLFIDGVALASGQIADTGNLFGPVADRITRVNSSSLLYHGLHFGIEYRR